MKAKRVKIDQSFDTCMHGIRDLKSSYKLQGCRNEVILSKNVFSMPMHTFSTIFWAAAKVFGRKGSINHRNASWQIDFWSNKKLPFLSAGALEAALELTDCLSTRLGVWKTCKVKVHLYSKTPVKGVAELLRSSSWHVTTLCFVIVARASMGGRNSFQNWSGTEWKFENRQKGKNTSVQAKNWWKMPDIFFRKQDSCLFWIWN